MESEKGTLFVIRNRKKKSMAAAACRNVCQIYREDAIDENIYRRWFRKFRKGDRSFQDQARSGWLSHVEENDIDQTIRNNPNPTVQELAETFNVHQTTVERQLGTLKFLRKLDCWVPLSLIVKLRDD
ncbi:histone-lysine N-methyltransferase SETMAR [Trichonephila clavipes]|nr:histone-lysine N-methyltransferase SETMAR [Trichonephila clavipes]